MICSLSILPAAPIPRHRHQRSGAPCLLQGAPIYGGVAGVAVPGRVHGQKESECAAVDRIKGLMPGPGYVQKSPKFIHDIDPAAASSRR